jgi:site-specific DNA-methyltransferase (adenine-specific)
MSRPVRPDRVHIYRAAADRLLGRLPDGSIDLLLTDPPYSSIDRHSGSGHLADWFPGSQSWAKIGKTLALGRRKLKPTGIAMVFTNGAGLSGALAAMTAAGFAEVRTLTWNRQWPGLGTGVRHMTEFILLGRLPGSRPVQGRDLLSVSAVGPGTANRYPTEKPVELGRVLAGMVGIGRSDVVVDPFCGSGALLLGPAERGATVIGGDISPRAVRRTTERLTEAEPPGRRGISTQTPVEGRPRGHATAAAPHLKGRLPTVARRQPPGVRDLTGPVRRPTRQAQATRDGKTGHAAGAARPRRTGHRRPRRR